MHDPTRRDRRPPEVGGLFDFPTGREPEEAAGDPPQQQDLFDGSESRRPVREQLSEEHGAGEPPSGQGPLAGEPSQAEPGFWDEPSGGFARESAYGSPEGFVGASERGGPEAAGPGARLVAGLADLLIHLTALLVVLVAAARLEIPLSSAQWPGFAVLVGSFSFLYVTLTLAFWGKTAGMAWQGLVARDREDQGLTFRQSMLRWLGAVVTLSLLGIPVLLSLRGGSLADRISATRTWFH